VRPIGPELIPVLLQNFENAPSEDLRETKIVKYFQFSSHGKNNCFLLEYCHDSERVR
jgi:hypothetical protein